MAVRKINKSWWIDFRFNGFRYRKRSPENSKVGGKAYEALIRQKLSRGEALEESKQEEYPSFKDFAWKWFETYVKPNNKASEIAHKEIALRVHLIPFFGKFRIDKITNLQIEEYKASKVKTNLVNKTINNQLTILSTCLRTAQEWLELKKIPRIKKLKVPPYKFDFLSKEESEILLNNSTGIWYDLFLVALKTGLRRGELLALTWEDINWEKRQIAVRQSMYNREITSTKSNRIRYVDMTNDVYGCLFARKKTKGFVFVDEYNKHFSMRRINDTIDQVCKKTGLRRITCHVLRHTFASHLAMAGAPIQAIQGLLGHSDIQTTMRYAHLSPSIYRETINLLELKPKNENFGQHMVNNHDISSRFKQVLMDNNIKNSANTKQKQHPSELSL